MSASQEILFTDIQATSDLLKHLSSMSFCIPCDLTTDDPALVTAIFLLLYTDGCL